MVVLIVRIRVSVTCGTQVPRYILKIKYKCQKNVSLIFIHVLSYPVPSIPGIDVFIFII